MGAIWTHRGPYVRVFLYRELNECEECILVRVRVRVLGLGLGC